MRTPCLVFALSFPLAAPLARAQANHDGREATAALSDAATKTGALPLQAGSADSALRVTLAPGAFTLLLSGADGGTGNHLVEIHEIR